MTHSALSKLTPEQRRIRIAEICGCVDIHLWPDGHSFCKKPRPCDGELSIYSVPNFLIDLNAMREALLCLTDLQFFYYGQVLAKEVMGLENQGNGPHGSLLYSGNQLTGVVNATAAQRADAFLLTVG